VCGIAGFLMSPGMTSSADSDACAPRMAGALLHRGPDDEGVWSDVPGIALARRRLAILDLSAAGHQSMVSASGRFVIFFNGDIYNNSELRLTLTNHGVVTAWRGHSDTETLLAGCEAWSVEKNLKHTLGMFALALWDRRDRSLTLARDRLGEKPLYYDWQGGSFLFGSELKALVVHPSWRADVNPDALALFMHYGYVPAPHSIWREVRKLLPGSYLTISADALPDDLPIIEAMMLSKPAVATDIRGSCEEAVPDETGLLVPLKAPDHLVAAIERFILNPDWSRALGAAGRRRALRLYDEDRVAALQLERIAEEARRLRLH
jgi:asparagine synthase (glutamine-hydrolysing)